MAGRRCHRHCGQTSYEFALVIAGGVFVTNASTVLGMNRARVRYSSSPVRSAMTIAT